MMQPSRLPFGGAHWADHVARHAFAIPEAVAIRYQGESITWAGLHERVCRAAAAFAGQGVRRGDRVAVLMTNRPEFLESVLAASAIGAIAVPVNFRLAPTEAAYIRTSRLTDDQSVGMINVPLFHIAGIGGMVPALLLGTRSVLMPTAAFDAQVTLDVIEAEGVTSLFLVPAQWQVLCAHPDVTRRTRSLRTISWGAAPATVPLLEAMAKTFPAAEIISVFGQTEMSPVTTALPSADAVRKIGSVGKPIPTIAARIVDDRMNDVPRGEVGEIVYRGPSLMAGYWNNPAATEEAFSGGWFHSGDLVREDEEGFLYVVDRKKDMIISGGENIYCAEVENVLSGHPAVADVAAIGARHEKWGETPVAVVVPADPAVPPTLEDLTGWTAGRLASYKKPTGLVVLDELPRNASGKVLKHELRARYGGS